jgi:pimeloyl-ACP methyl ester carboxylesterase
VSFEVAARAGWLIALVGAVGYVPVTWIRGERVRATWFSRLPRGLADLAQRVERSAMEVVLQTAGTFTGATNHRVEIMLSGRRYALDDMKAGVLRQFAQCVRRRAFVSALGAPEHVYSDHYHLIGLPTLVVQGGRDRVANAEMTRSAFFDVIPATDKTWLFLEPIAHGEIEAAPAACVEAYPQIRAWMDARRARCG